MLTEAEAREAEAMEYLLGLMDLGPEMYAAAHALYQRALARDVAPVLKRQRNMLSQSFREAQAGAPITHSDASVAALDAQLATAWTRCLEQLRRLWLTSPHAVAPEEVSP